MSEPASQESLFSNQSNPNLSSLSRQDGQDVINPILSAETKIHHDEEESAQIFTSPTTITTQSARSDAQSATLRSRKTKSPTTTSPQAPPSVDQQLKKPEIQIADTSIAKAFQRSALHMLPVLVTSALITIGAGEVYMADLNGFPGQDVVLQALQFAVKAHEILMLVSLGDIVLHRIRWDLVMGNGVPFGMLSAGYQLSDIGYLFSPEFRANVWEKSFHSASLPRLTLTLLIVLCCVLSLVVGPSSGVLMIPKLNWWPLKKPCGPMGLRTFQSYSSQELLWPTSFSTFSDGGTLYPGSAADYIRFLAGTILFNNATQRYPMLDYDVSFYRWLISNSTNYDGWTVSTSPMTSMSMLLGQYWEWISYENLEPITSLAQPQISLESIGNGTISQPLVQVQCSAHFSNDNKLDLTLPNDHLISTLPDAYANLTWPIHLNYSTANLSEYANNLYWARLPLNNYKHAPSDGLVFVLMDEFSHKVTVPCSVLIHWVPSNIYIRPKMDNNIHDDTNWDPVAVVHRTDIDLAPSAELTFSNMAWESLENTDGSMAMEQIFQGLNTGAYSDGIDRYTGGERGFAYEISTLVGVFFTDAISRYSPLFSDSVVIQDFHNGSEPLGRSLEDITDRIPLEFPQKYRSFLEYVEADSNMWQEVTISLSRYGYAWSFSGILSKLGGLALLLQSILATMHIALLLSGGWSSNAWASIGDMLALSLRSDTPVIAPDHRTGEEEKETWRGIVRVRLIGNDLKLVLSPQRAETLRLIRK